MEFGLNRCFQIPPGFRPRSCKTALTFAIICYFSKDKRGLPARDLDLDLDLDLDPQGHGTPLANGGLQSTIPRYT